MKTFNCYFGKGVSCEIQVTDKPPEEGKPHIQRFTWKGSPTEKMIGCYMVWIHSINEQLAEEWGIKIMHVFQISPIKREFWQYEPGKAGEKVTLS